jgi:hypothetical protein
MGRMTCASAHAEKEEPSGTLTQFKKQICGAFHGGLVHKCQNFSRLSNVLSNVVHAI